MTIDPDIRDALWPEEAQSAPIMAIAGIAMARRDMPFSPLLHQGK
jgi:hypothetical protein